MPLDFDGLKKQRYRWALGGVQILRSHWRELIPGVKHSFKLSTAQRLHYLLGSLQWFGDLLTAAFTILLTLTAIGIALNHRLPVRQLTGALVLVPLAFLFSGLLRAAWAMKTVERCSWGDAVRALRVWFALSWVVTLACAAGLVRESAVFLRTPKSKEGEATILKALSSSKVETGLGALAVLAAWWMLMTAHTFPFLILAGMLVFEAAVYFSAPWASAAAEGITLTPFRQIYRSSAQNTGDRPTWTGRAMAVPAGAALGVGIALAAGLLAVAPGTGTPTPPGLPGGVLPAITAASPTPEASPTPSPAASAAATPPALITPKANPPPSSGVSPRASTAPAPAARLPGAAPAPSP
jgi:hypothetical protein